MIWRVGRRHTSKRRNDEGIERTPWKTDRGKCQRTCRIPQCDNTEVDTMSNRRPFYLPTPTQGTGDMPPYMLVLTALEQNQQRFR
jgi:hypothetical protein